MTAVARTKELAKPLAGAIFVIFWVIAIVAWIVAGSFADVNTRGFVIDVGIIFACVGFAAPFIGTMKGLSIVFLLGLIGIALFAIGAIFDLTAVIYTIRILAPFLALQAPLYKVVGGIRVFT
jgi:hypothetical protein